MSAPRPASVAATRVTDRVLASLEGCTDARLREVIASLVRHLHAFASEVRLREPEWARGIGFLTEVGHITDERRQEFVLLSDVLGLSTLVTALDNDQRPAGCTPATVLGPFHAADAPPAVHGADITNGARGAPCQVSGRVRSADGRPLPGARVEVWQSDEDGLYDLQRPPIDGATVHRARARLHTDADGRFTFRSIVASPYPIPHDGPVGGLLAALGRHPWRPAHLHFIVEAAGHRRLVTQVFREGDPWLGADAVFADGSPALVARWAPRSDAPDGPACLDFEFVLAPDDPAVAA